MKSSWKRAAIGAALLGLATAPAEARVTGVEIIKREPAFGGQAFGAVGAYEHLVGRVTGELDPADPANAIIQDINLAPRNARGMVEYTTDIEILKPDDIARGNRMLFFEVNNRGNKLALSAFDEAVAGSLADRNRLSSPGDGWLMRAGYTMIWFGWEMDVRPGMNRIGMAADGRPAKRRIAVTGIVRSEMSRRRPPPSCRSAEASRC